MVMQAATGCIAGPMERFSQGVQTAASYADFLGSSAPGHKVFYFNILDKGDPVEFMESNLHVARMPYIVMWPDYPLGYSIGSDGTNSTASRGTIQVSAVQEVKEYLDADTVTKEEIHRKHDNFYGKFLPEIFNAARDNNLMSLRLLDSLQLHMTAAKKQNGMGLAVGAMFKIHWGVPQ